MRQQTYQLLEDPTNYKYSLRLNIQDVFFSKRVYIHTIVLLLRDN